jgi:TonB-dependent receptor
MVFGKTRLIAKLAMGSCAAALLCVAGMGEASAQVTPEGTNADAQIETVVVTGFKASIERALDAKRNALDSTDTILAEDIAKFPDLNLSESIQRLPGVAITRDEGEGREISVRGLGPTFTRVRINGMEALTTTGSEDATGGTNRNRSFDFNVFASDLFTAITLHKTASGEIEEGSLGATVDLHTAHPFDYDKFTFVANAQEGYSELGGGMDPRGSFLVADTFMGGKLGVLVSASYAVQRTIENGPSTVQWQNDNTADTLNHSAPMLAGCTSGCTATTRVGSVTLPSTAGYVGLPGTIAQTAGTTETAGAPLGGLPNDYDVVNEAYHPRFPRYDEISNNEKRAGLSASVQYQPDSNTLFTLDLLGADFAVVRTENQLEAQGWEIAGTRSGAGLGYDLGLNNIDVTNYAVDQSLNNLNYVTANNVNLRAEHRLDHLNTRFYQGTLDVTHQFSDIFKVHGLFGWSQSNHKNPIQTTLTMDYGQTGGTSAAPTGGAQGYSFDYRGDLSKMPAISYGSTSVTDANGWFLSQIRERAEYNYNRYTTAQGDAEYDISNAIKLKGGFDYRVYANRTADLRRTNGNTTTLDGYIPTSVAAIPLSQYTSTVKLTGLTPGAGTPTAWLVPSIGKLNALVNIFSPTTDQGLTTVINGKAPTNNINDPVVPGGGMCATGAGCGAFQLGPESALSANGSITEEDVAGWLQVDWDTMFYGVPFRGNIGARYVTTSTSALGYNFLSATKTYIQNTANNSYHNFLPSINMVFTPVDDFLIRAAASEVMTRPDLTSMLPGGASASVSGGSHTIKLNNPNLKPYTAKAVDLAFEWYYHKGALLSIALFYKHLDTLIQSVNVIEPVTGNSFGVDPAVAEAACGGTPSCADNTPWTFTVPQNIKGGGLYGTEINWQQPFDFLPGPLDNTGFLGNVTFVQSQEHYILNPATGATFLADLNNLSRTSYNATLYYDDGTFQTRVSAAFRSKYIPNGGVNPSHGGDIQVIGSTLNVDASASYKINDSFTVSLQGLNLTNQFSYAYLDSVGQRLYYNHQTGREFFLGLRYAY